MPELFILASMKRTMLTGIVPLVIGSAFFLAGCPASSETEEPPSNTAGKSEEPANVAAENSAATPGSFADAHAVLTRVCMGCHGATNPKHGFSVVTYDSVMKGDEHGPVIVAGDPANSKIVKVLRDDGPDRMPFKMDPLPEEDIAKIEAWIAAGAKSQ